MRDENDARTVTRPLTGVRVVDLSTSYAGPTATMLLGDMGADIVKVERPRVGDDTRHRGPPFVGDQSAWFISANRNKRSIALNLRSAGGREVLERLLDDADVFLESFNPAKLTQLGIEPASVRARWPRIIYCALSGFGLDGPDWDRPGYDLIAQARSGMMSVTGEAGGTPQRVSTALSDVATGILAALAITGAVRHQDSTGEGGQIDVSLLDADLALMAPRIASYLAGEPEPAPSGATDSVLAIYQTFPTADRPIAIAIGNDRMWQRFCRVVGLDGLADDASLATNADRREHRERLVQAIEDCLVRQPAAHWLAVLRDVDVPSCAVQSLSEVVDDPQVVARRSIQSLKMRDGSMLDVVGRPWNCGEDDPTPPPTPPPELGEHGREILASLDYTADEVDRLIDQEAVWVPTS